MAISLLDTSYMFQVIRAM